MNPFSVNDLLLAVNNSPACLLTSPEHYNLTVVDTVGLLCGRESHFQLVDVSVGKSLKNVLL